MLRTLSPAAHFSHLLIISSVVLMLCHPCHATPGLPESGTVTLGSATIDTSEPGLVRIAQGTARAIIDWHSFNIDRHSQVVIQQPARSSLMLFRVTGDAGSVLAGRLQANGDVALMNPNGITIAAGAVINAGGFLASTALLTGDSDGQQAMRHLDGGLGMSPLGALIPQDGIVNMQASRRDGVREVVNRAELSLQPGVQVAFVNPAARESTHVPIRIGARPADAATHRPLIRGSRGSTVRPANALPWHAAHAIDRIDPIESMPPPVPPRPAVVLTPRRVMPERPRVTRANVHRTPSWRPIIQRAVAATVNGNTYVNANVNAHVNAHVNTYVNANVNANVNGNANAAAAAAPRALSTAMDVPLAPVRRGRPAWIESAPEPAPVPALAPRMAFSRGSGGTVSSLLSCFSCQAEIR